jgi:hypothetical protein
MSVYGKCELKSKQATAEIYDISNQKDIIENWVAENWSVGFSVGGTNNSEIFVTTPGIYRYDLTMVGTFNGGTNDGIEYQLKDNSGNILHCGCSYNGNGNINIGNISGLLQILDVSNGFKIHGHMNGGGNWTNCSFALQLIN